MKSTNTRLGSIYGFLLIGTLTTGCGQQWVKDINVEAYDGGGGAPHARITTLLDMGNISLPNMSFPILHPTTGVELGEIRLGTEGSYDAVGIDLNVGALAGVSGCPGGAKLPNGQDLPLSVETRENIVCLPVGGADIRIFVKLNLTADQALIGAAIPVKPMDQLGKSLSPSSWFTTFLIRGEIPGTFGLFMGPQAGQNGLAFFFELDSLLEKVGPIVIGGQTLDAGGRASIQSLTEVSAETATAPKERIEFKNVKPSSSRQMKIYNYMDRLNRDEAILSVH